VTNVLKRERGQKAPFLVLDGSGYAPAAVTVTNASPAVRASVIFVIPVATAAALVNSHLARGEAVPVALVNQAR